MSLLQLDGVCKEYISGGEPLTILKELSFSVDRGSSVVICGESGCGKSTLLSLIGGLDRPSQGAILYESQEISTFGERRLNEYRRKNIGFIFQFHYLLKDFTALENVALAGRIAGLSGKEALKRSAEMLSSVGLDKRSGHYPDQLSGGEAQRVAVSRALLCAPPLLLADEPTGNLDEKNSRIVEDILFTLVKEMNVTLILATHDQRLASRGERHLYLREGSLH